jgi:hypothetical protein
MNTTVTIFNSYLVLMVEETGVLTENHHPQAIP